MLEKNREFYRGDKRRYILADLYFTSLGQAGILDSRFTQKSSSQKYNLDCPLKN
jgi:hypothetical protein